MAKYQIFSKKEKALGELIVGIIALLIGLMWEIRVIRYYNIENANLITNIQFTFPLLYGIGLIIGGVVLIIYGYKKIKKAKTQ